MKPEEEIRRIYEILLNERTICQALHLPCNADRFDPLQVTIVEERNHAQICLLEYILGIADETRRSHTTCPGATEAAAKSTHKRSRIYRRREV